ncbi:MAG: hypothetical protein IJ418_18025 [Clostridia bacterium]|nr:hypothetical protein [Clostridia bacterium]
MSTFYGSNLLTTIAENCCWHPYSKHWFEKTLFTSAPLGLIPNSSDWSPDPNQITDSKCAKRYRPNSGCSIIQGNGVVCGKLFGGNGETLLNCASHNANLVNTQDFDGAVFFIEDLPQAWNEAYVEKLFHWLGKESYLQILSGIVIGKLCEDSSILPYHDTIRRIVSDEYSLPNLPILYGLNFGHTSPICMLPYDVKAEINADNLSFQILEPAVL